MQGIHWIVLGCSWASCLDINISAISRSPARQTKTKNKWDGKTWDNLSNRCISRKKRYTWSTSMNTFFPSIQLPTRNWVLICDSFSWSIPITYCIRDFVFAKATYWLYCNRGAILHFLEHPFGVGENPRQRRLRMRTLRNLNLSTSNFMSLLTKCITFWR